MEVSDAAATALPEDVYNFISHVCLLASNHGGWFDKEGFAVMSPICDEANRILQMHASATQSAELDALREEVELGQMHYRRCNNALNKERARAQSAEATIAQLRDRVAGLEELLRDAGTTSVRLEYSAGWHARRRALLTQNEVG
ncbi:hypothetical protein [Sphingobium fluviale]|uniref:Uncharacterized protein n=1 Tax=Sphingobium fluviale TaxID=2506423 RepID=A0A4Q1KK25_9SPHN|nr:hypothetical protein [Sphingobium fluviale]RXR28994.1 hypothetical protein EQG66_07905 [Sphingobium fluviale]